MLTYQAIQIQQVANEGVVTAVSLTMVLLTSQLLTGELLRTLLVTRILVTGHREERSDDVIHRSSVEQPSNGLLRRWTEPARNDKGRRSGSFLSVIARSAATT